MAYLFGIQNTSNNADLKEGMSGQNYWLGQRWTAPAPMTVSGIYFTGEANYAGSLLVALESNSAGNPSNTLLTSGIATFTSGRIGLPNRNFINFSSNYVLTSGTIYHTVWQNGLGASLGAGSRFVLKHCGVSGTNVYIQNNFGSLFIESLDPNFQTEFTSNSGGTWTANPGTRPQPLSWMLYESGAIPGSDLKRIGWVGSSIQATTGWAGSLWTGNYMRSNQSYSISGIFGFFTAIQANVGSLWAKIEYSGAYVAGARAGLGSWIMGVNPTAGWVSTQAYTTIPAGSEMYIFFYAPQGATGAGSAFAMHRIEMDDSQGFGFGAGSYLTVNTTDAGSTTTVQLTDYRSIYFAASGGAAAVTYDDHGYSDALTHVEQFL